MLHEALPAPVARVLDENGLDDPPLLLSTAADLAADGRFERQWLAVTEKHLTVIADGPTPQLLRSLLVAEVESFRAKGVLGSGLLSSSLVSGLREYLADLDPYAFFGRTDLGAGTRLSRSQLLNVTAGGGSAAPVFTVTPRDM